MAFAVTATMGTVPEQGQAVHVALAPSFVQPLQRLLPGSGLVTAQPPLRELLARDLPGDKVVVHHEGAHASQMSPWRPSRAGLRIQRQGLNQKVDPFPASLRTPICPPIISVSRNV